MNEKFEIVFMVTGLKKILSCFISTSIESPTNFLSDIVFFWNFMSGFNFIKFLEKIHFLIFLELKEMLWDD